MGVFSASEADNYGSNGGSGFFTLKNDKDVARVRFLYNGIEDLEGYAVHEVEVNEKKRYVNCLRSYKDPLDVCPFCAAKKSQKAKLFIPLYNIDDDSVQIWERGKNFLSTLSSAMSRYPNFVSHIFEVERNGKPKDTKTTYMLYEVDQDDTKLEDFEVPEILGGVVMDKSADDMEYFLQEGEFPPEDEEEEAPRRRGSGRSGRESNRNEEPEEALRGRRASSQSQERETTRRTPQRSGGRREF